jgi:hypothetical protein
LAQSQWSSALLWEIVYLQVQVYAEEGEHCGQLVQVEEGLIEGHTIAAIWLGDRLARLFRLVHLNISTSSTTTMVVQVYAEEGEHCGQLVQVEEGLIEGVADGRGGV